MHQNKDYKILRGKFLLRPEQINGQDVLVLGGVFYPNFDVSEINDPEMRISEIILTNKGIKFTHPTEEITSLDDFISGISQLPSEWNRKYNLDE